MKTVPWHPPERSRASKSLFFTATALFALGIALLAISGCALLSPSSKPSASTGDVAAEGGSRITQITFQSLAGKAGWGGTIVGLLGWIAATIKARRREQAADELIRSIEASGSAAKIVKSHVRNKGIAWLDRRVACLSKKHGWGRLGRARIGRLG